MIIIFDILKQLIAFLKFHFVRIGKWFAILFKRNRQLKKLSFDYYKNWHSNNSYLLVDFKFRNAIYFKVGNNKSFDFTKPLILNLQRLNTEIIKVEVFGFFQKLVLIIELNKEFQFNSKPLRAEIKNISPVEITRQKIRTKKTKLWMTRDKIKVANKSVSINTPQIAIKYNNFNNQDLS